MEGYPHTSFSPGLEGRPGQGRMRGGVGENQYSAPVHYLLPIRSSPGVQINLTLPHCFLWNSGGIRIQVPVDMVLSPGFTLPNVPERDAGVAPRITPDIQGNEDLWAGKVPV
jgi:hypothetical protein